MNTAPYTYTISANWGSTMGGSKDNPFLQRAAMKTYDETIHPQKVVKGIMQIREQLKGEWVNDLGTIDFEDHIFFEELENEVTQASLAEAAQRAARSEGRKGGVNATGAGGDKPGPKTLTSRAPDPAREEREFTSDFRTASGRELNSSPWGSLGVSDNLVVQSIRGEAGSTPLRGKNFDLCKKAATYIAVLQVLAKLDGGGEEKARAQGAWLRQTWDAEFKTLFESDSGRYVSEHFLAGLARKPSLAMPVGGKLFSVDPMDLTKKVVEARRKVLQGWQDYLDSDQVESGHTEIMRDLLIKSFGTL